jgi:PAS domain S-box-containing protein
MTRNKPTYEELEKRVRELEKADAESGRGDQALRESEGRYRRLAENARDMIYRMSLPSGKYEYVSPASKDIFGYAPDEFYSTPQLIAKVIHPYWLEIFAEQWKKLLAGDMPAFYEYKIIDKAGDERWLYQRNVLVLGDDDKPFALEGIVTDITDRKQAEQALRESEDRLQLAMDAGEHAFWDYNLDTGDVFFSPRYYTMLGYEIGELPKRIETWVELMHPEDRKTIVPEVLEYVKNAESYSVDFRLKCKDGSYRWISGRGKSFEIDEQGVSHRAVGIHVDITERKQAEEALRESEEMFRVTAQKTGQMVYDYYPATGKIKWEGAVEALTGQTYEDIQSCDVNGWEELVHEEDRKTILDELDIAQQKCSSYDVEYRFRQKNGCFLFVEEHGVFLPDSEGKAVRMLGSLKDITERKQAEEALRESRETYRTLLENLPQKIFYKDNNSVFISCNANFARDLHIQPAEVAGKTDWDFFPKELAEKYRADDSRIIKSGRMADFEEAYNQDGKEVIVYTVKTPVRDGDGKVVGLLGIFWDITERKQLEEERKKASRLESIGVLAGGIAHDFNNILTAVLGNISLAHAIADEDINKAKEILAEAEQAALSAKDLTLQLLTFARGGEPVKKIISISSLISDTARFALRGSNVKSDLQLERDLWPVDADEGQIKQVINNIVINACQAMPRGGLISIQTANLGVGSGDSLPLAEGKYIRTTIADQGIGIADEYLAQIFDPYFTTKQKGSGLGLATSYSIVKRHGGHITVESDLNAGSKFHIYLPASMKPVEAKEVKMGAIPTAGGRILVMDDEKILCDAVARMLKYLGHEVEVVGDGVEAVRGYGDAIKANRPFDVVILDLTIPGGMGGKETIKQLLELDPDVKTIVSSGYSNDSVMSNFKEYGFSGMVAKPYQIDELKKVLFEVLEK